MPNQPNMYRGINKEIEEVNKKIDYAAGWENRGTDEEEVGIVFGDEAEKIHDDVVGLTAKLEVLDKGLKKDSETKRKFQKNVKTFNKFLGAEKRNKKGTARQAN